MLAFDDVDDVELVDEVDEWVDADEAAVAAFDEGELPSFDSSSCTSFSSSECSFSVLSSESSVSRLSTVATSLLAPSPVRSTKGGDDDVLDFLVDLAPRSYESSCESGRLACVDELGLSLRLFDALLSCTYSSSTAVSAALSSAASECSREYLTLVRVSSLLLLLLAVAVVVARSRSIVLLLLLLFAFVSDMFELNIALLSWPFFFLFDSV